MRRSYLVAALLLPLLAVVLAIVQSELSLGGSRDFLFAIRGYDPRDFLRGRYLQFRLHIDRPAEREPCDATADDCCLCLTRVGEDVPVRAERATCRTARESCDGALRVRYLDDPLRYYVAEHDARALERRLVDAMQRDRAFAVLAVDRHGDAMVRELRVDGEVLTAGAPETDASDMGRPTAEP